MFEVLVNLKSVGTYPSFIEAATKFFEEIDTFLQEGTSYQRLETANFLVSKKTSEIGVMTFYDARDFSCKLGLLAEGKLQQGVAEPSAEVVASAFKECAQNRAIAETQGLIAMVRDMLQVIAN